MVERKRTPLPIYVSGGSKRWKLFAKRPTRSRSMDKMSPIKTRKNFLQAIGCKWNVFWVLFIITFMISMVCLLALGFMVQRTMPSNNEVSGGKNSTRGVLAKWKEN
ncbi:unnamed protein product [Peronospora destructor]|uniref:Uncharacterized protein n=1 Tax=Peronospora destructor TaxID=86335 RepID=A0AAV0TPS3_9STRA|nr:unnamed protein product [Peronospora destructor]